MYDGVMISVWTCGGIISDFFDHNWITLRICIESILIYLSDRWAYESYLGWDTLVYIIFWLYCFSRWDKNRGTCEVGGMEGNIRISRF